MTQALSSNVFPHSTFNWVGIDGTQVLCHMTPVGKDQGLHVEAVILMGSLDTYTAQATVGDVNKGLANHKVGIPRNQEHPITDPFIRTSNLQIKGSSCSVMAMVEEVLWPVCLKM